MLLVQRMQHIYSWNRLCPTTSQATTGFQSPSTSMIFQIQPLETQRQHILRPKHIKAGQQKSLNFPFQDFPSDSFTITNSENVWYKVLQCNSWKLKSHPTDFQLHVEQTQRIWEKHYQPKIWQTIQKHWELSRSTTPTKNIYLQPKTINCIARKRQHKVKKTITYEFENDEIRQN